MESPKSINKRIDAFFISNVADRRTNRHQVLFIQIDVIARVTYNVFCTRSVCQGPRRDHDAAVQVMKKYFRMKKKTLSS